MLIVVKAIFVQIIITFMIILRTFYNTTKCELINVVQKRTTMTAATTKCLIIIDFLIYLNTISIFEISLERSPIFRKCCILLSALNFDQFYMVMFGVLLREIDKFLSDLCKKKVFKI